MLIWHFCLLLNTQCSAHTDKSIIESVDKPSEIGHIQNDEIFMQTYLLIIFCFESHSELPFLLISALSTGSCGIESSSLTMRLLTDGYS